MRLARLLSTASCGVLAVVTTAVLAQQSTENYTYDALGRVVEAKTVGGNNDGETHSICYDASGNRIEYATTTDGTATACMTQGAQGGAPTPTPSPPPPPPPTNSPPLTVNDAANLACDQVASVNLTANDSDPESNYPLVLTAITGGGAASAAVISDSTVSVDAGPLNATTVFTYTVEDSLNAGATGTLTVNTSGCVPN